MVFASDLQAVMDVPAPLAANVLRVLGDDGVRVRDLSGLTGIATNGIDNSLTTLTKRGLATIDSPGNGRPRLVRATVDGQHAQHVYRAGVESIEQACA